MAARRVVGALVIVCFIILHVECLPRVGRDDYSVADNGSGYESAYDSEEYEDNAGASDADALPTEEQPHDSGTDRDEQPDESGYSVDLGNGVNLKEPAPTPVDESSEEFDNSVGVSDEDNSKEGNGIVSKPNKEVVIDSEDKPAFSFEEHAPNDKDLVLDLEKEEGPSESNERDKFFGKPEPVKPPIANTVDLVGTGGIRTDVMLFFDDAVNNDDSDDAQITPDPEIVSLERGDYKKDDFFDTIGMEKLDDFIPKATETKKAQDFIEGQTASSKDTDEFFGRKGGSGGKTMKDDFFDSIAVKNIVADKIGLNVESGKKSKQIGGSLSHIGTHGLGSEMTFDEELKMQQLILKALRSFIGAPCYKEGRLRMTRKCAVFEDVLNAMALSGLTFNNGDRVVKPIASKTAGKWKW